MAGLLAKLKIEAKVWAATSAALAVSILIAVLNAVEADHSLLGDLPGGLQSAILIVGPTVATFVSGWAAKHTPRSPDAP